jgi:hypothetical protein
MDLVVERHYKRCEKSPIDAAAVLVGTELIRQKHIDRRVNYDDCDTFDVHSSLQIHG